MPPRELQHSTQQTEQHARRYARAVAVGDGVVLSRVLGAYLLYIDLDDSALGAHLCMDGFWEAWTTHYLARTIQPDWYCLDIGANVGYFTLLMADCVGRYGHVCAVEPHPRLAGLLRRSLIANFAERRVTVRELAVAAQPGSTVALVAGRHRSAEATITRPAAPGDERHNVTTTTLDEIVNGWPRLDMIKIDAEGAEDSIWAGGSKTFATYRDVRVVLEFVAERYADPERFLALIRADGFELQVLNHTGEIGPADEVELLRSTSEHYPTLLLQRG